VEHKPRGFLRHAERIALPARPEIALITIAAP
jgi:hypothetical protein